MAATRNRKTSSVAPEPAAGPPRSGSAGKTTSGTKASARSEAAVPPEPTQTVRPARASRKKDETRASVSQAARHLRPIGLLLALLVSVYTLVALATWNPLDPSFTRSSGSKVTNAAGPVGAWVSDLLFQVLGHGAWVMLPLAILSAALLARRHVGGPGRLFGGLTLLWATLAIIASLLPSQAGDDFPAGGIVGEVSVQTLRGLVGPAGTWIVAVGTALAALPFVAPLRLEELASRLLGGVEVAVPRVGSLGLSLGRRAVGGVSAAGARVADRIREAREEQAELDDEEPSLSELDEPPALAEAGSRALSEQAPPFALELPESMPRRSGRPTAWSDASPPDQLTNGFERGTAASGRQLVEAEWDPTLPPDDVRDTIAAADLLERSIADIPPREPRGLPREPGALRPEATSPPAVARPVAKPAPRPGPRTPPPDELDYLNAPEPGSLASVSLLPEPQLDLPAVRPAARPAAGSRRAIVSPGQLVSGGGVDDRDLLVEGSETTFELPHLGLLDEHERDIARFDEAELQALAEVLESKLADFGVKGEVVAIRPGPVVTTFEYVPAPGIKLSKISALSDDVAMALKALRVRIVAPIPGKGVVGIEIPNKFRQTVWLRDMLASEAFRKNGGALPMVLGKTVEGKPYVGNLANMPHLLVGGTTGSGKSVGVNGMLVSMLYTRTPEELRLILIDPKMLEFELYRDIPHLLHPVVTEPKLASAALKWACVEMDERYRTLARWGVRNITSFNKKLESERAEWSAEKAWRYAPADWAGDVPPPLPRVMPYIVIVIDELADLMMVAAKDVEESIIRLAQKARASGIHLIVATQRPSVNVITGLIKANMPSRIAFQVRTRVDGRTILDQNGAENLLGKGDMLFLPPGVSDLERVHGPFVSDEEVRRVNDFLREQGSPNYEAQIVAEDEGEGVAPLGEGEYDDLYDLAVAYVCRQGKASASMIQREFKIGYNRAARILEIMERDGVVGPADGARPREVLAGSHAS